jgi:hypothetical protein
MGTVHVLRVNLVLEGFREKNRQEKAKKQKQFKRYMTLAWLLARPRILG